MDILFQDPAILVIDKPAGVSVLPDGWEKGAPFLLEQLEDQFGKCWVVHRLDKVTSGVMLFARTAEAHRNLNLQFEHREIHKEYHAILTGLPLWENHTAHHPLRINVGHSHRTTVDHTRGKPAETQFFILERFAGHCLVEALPSTGRTHQIRVHAFALGYPLLGDTLYDAPATDLIARPALHALSIRFAHPFTNATMTFSAPYPVDFKMALESLKAGVSYSLDQSQESNGN
jgi:tRNA pseudouridine32 synthase / 23S rRNA pseudouridine746 synthase